MEKLSGTRYSPELREQAVRAYRASGLVFYVPAGGGIKYDAGASHVERLIHARG